MPNDRPSVPFLNTGGAWPVTLFWSSAAVAVVSGSPWACAARGQARTSARNRVRLSMRTRLATGVPRLARARTRRCTRARAGAPGADFRCTAARRSHTGPRMEVTMTHAKVFTEPITSLLAYYRTELVHHPLLTAAQRGELS